MTPDGAALVIFIGGAEDNPGALASRVGTEAESLARLHRAGLRVPPALAIARRDGAQDAFAGSLRAELAAGVRRLERETSLVSIRRPAAARRPVEPARFLNARDSRHGAQRRAD